MCNHARGCVRRLALPCCACARALTQVTWENSLGLLLDTHAVIDARTTSVTLPAQVSPDAAVRAASAAVAAELSKMQVSLSMRRDVYVR